MRKSIFIFVFLSLLALPIISAQYYGGGWNFYGASPSYYLNNEWVMFGIIFIVFFGVIYHTLFKSFQQKMTAAVVALGISLFIAMTLTQGGFMNGYIGDQIGSWALFMVIIIGIGFLIKFTYDALGNVGVAFLVIGLWFMARSFNPMDILPYQMQNDTILNVYYLFSSVLGLFIIIFAAILLMRTVSGPTVAEQLFRQLRRRG